MSVPSSELGPPTPTPASVFPMEESEELHFRLSLNCYIIGWGGGGIATFPHTHLLFCSVTINAKTTVHCSPGSSMVSPPWTKSGRLQHSLAGEGGGPDRTTGQKAWHSVNSVVENFMTIIDDLFICIGRYRIVVIVSSIPKEQESCRTAKIDCMVHLQQENVLDNFDNLCMATTKNCYHTPD